MRGTSCARCSKTKQPIIGHQSNTQTVILTELEAGQAIIHNAGTENLTDGVRIRALP